VLGWIVVFQLLLVVHIEAHLSSSSLSLKHPRHPPIQVRSTLSQSTYYSYTGINIKSRWIKIRAGFISNDSPPGKENLGDSPPREKADQEREKEQHSDVTTQQNDDCSPTMNEKPMEREVMSDFTSSLSSCSTDCTAGERDSSLSLSQSSSSYEERVPIESHSSCVIEDKDRDKEKRENTDGSNGLVSSERETHRYSSENDDREKRNYLIDPTIQIENVGSKYQTKEEEVVDTKNETDTHQESEESERESERKQGVAIDNAMMTDKNEIKVESSEEIEDKVDDQEDNEDDEEEKEEEEDESQHVISKSQLEQALSHAKAMLQSTKEEVQKVYGWTLVQENPRFTLYKRKRSPGKSFLILFVFLFC
jgi:hypothetical protein